MKLGTKIMAGFAAICIIFAVLTIFIFVLLRGLQAESRELAGVILPTSVASSDILGRMGLVSFYSNDYYYSSNQESMRTAVTEHEAIEVQLQLVKKNFNEPAIQRNPELRDAITALLKNYSVFYDSVGTINNDLKAIVVAREALQANYANLVKICVEFMRIQQEALTTAIEAGDMDQVNKLNERGLAVRSIRDNLDTNLIALLRGQQFRKVSYFEDANTIASSMLERAQWLQDTSYTPSGLRLSKEIVTIVSNTAAVGRVLSDAVIASFENTNKRGALRDIAMKDASTVSGFTDRQSQERLEVTNVQLNTVIISLLIGLAVSIIVGIILATFIIRDITKQVNILVDTLSDGASQVDSASSQLTTASNALAEGATENAASLEETSAALEELSSMSRRNADNSVEANTLMNQAASAVDQATNSMSDVIKAMGEISISGNEIGKIIKTIDEIAFQTNLLALNAAVEAARAGEAGAGFAVVADEVRNLAIRSADAAKNTSDLIASTISNISSGTSMVNTTADNFKIVAERSGKIAELLSEISEASEEQSQGIGQITTAMTEMDKVTQSNAASAEESASAATELSQQAGNLLDAVDDLNTLVHGQQGQGGNKQPMRTITATTARKPSSKVRALPEKSGKRGGDMNMDDDFNF